MLTEMLPHAITPLTVRAKIVGDEGAAVGDVLRIARLDLPHRDVQGGVQRFLLEQVQRQRDGEERGDQERAGGEGEFKRGDAATVGRSPPWRHKADPAAARSTALAPEVAGLWRRERGYALFHLLSQMPLNRQDTSGFRFGIQRWARPKLSGCVSFTRVRLGVFGARSVTTGDLVRVVAGKLSLVLIPTGVS
jgi:hypothetical protein